MLGHPRPAGRSRSIPGPIVASPDPKVNHHPTNSHRRSASGNPVYPRREHHRSARQYQAFPRRPARPAARRPEEECHQEAPARRSRSDRNRRRCRLRSMARNHQPGLPPCPCGCPPDEGLPAVCPPEEALPPCCWPPDEGLPAGWPPGEALPPCCWPPDEGLPAGWPPDVGLPPCCWPPEEGFPGAWPPDVDGEPPPAVPRIAAADPKTGSPPVRHPHRSLAGAAHFRSSRRKNPATGLPLLGCPPCCPEEFSVGLPPLCCSPD
jgi:hypothetical protein